MWEFAERKTNGLIPLTSEDVAIFHAFQKIREELDGYHGRVTFDDRNIEDILSILSFNTLGGTKRDKDKLAEVNRAIGRTIELCCTIEHPGVTREASYSANESGPSLYRDFWKNLFAITSPGKGMPTIITFNYDLVLERSLFQTLIGTNFGSSSNRFPAERIAINYCHDHVPRTEFEVSYTTFTKHSRIDTSSHEGTVLKAVEPSQKAGVLEIDLLKLHGSLNFPRKQEAQPGSFVLGLTKAISDPFILPPIFNKMTNGAPTTMWKAALDKLRRAKNIVIVGYSLPRTDVYMQYFLKAALGPNLNLNKIFVFDPILFSNGAACEEMIQRYESCFSAQLRSRIDFRPDRSSLPDAALPGTADHFVYLLRKNRGGLIF